MTVYCKVCGIPLKEKVPKKYFCPDCNKYTDFIELKPELHQNNKEKPEDLITH